VVSKHFCHDQDVRERPWRAIKGRSTHLCVAGMGAAYGTAKSGVGIASMGVMRPELVMKSIVPVVMAGVLGIYGLIIAVIISTNSEFHSAGCGAGVRLRLLSHRTCGWASGGCLVCTPLAT
jgi:ATP synthase proteolipid subunit